MDTYKNRMRSSQKCICQTRNTFYISILLAYTSQIVVVHSTIVYDKNQEHKNLDKYCSAEYNCIVGEHVMCMYGNYVDKMGPRCSEGVSVPMTDDVKKFLLDYFNRLKRNIAKGIEIGKDNKTLPRGYGLYKLVWHNELSLFAQAWANQCYLKRDHCRNTKNFPDTNQLVTEFRFEENWGTAYKKFKDENKFTNEKLYFALNMISYVIYDDAMSLTKADIEHYKYGSDNLYAVAVHGMSTHVGCAISRYRDYYFRGDNNYLAKTIQLVCNFSLKPIYNRELYSTNAANTAGASSCGCTRNFIDEDCLCTFKTDPETKDDKEKNGDGENSDKDNDSDKSDKDKNKDSDSDNKVKNGTDSDKHNNKDSESDNNGKDKNINEDGKDGDKYNDKDSNCNKNATGKNKNNSVGIADGGHEISNTDGISDDNNIN